MPLMGMQLGQSQALVPSTLNSHLLTVPSNMEASGSVATKLFSGNKACFYVTCAVPSKETLTMIEFRCTGKGSNFDKE